MSVVQQMVDNIRYKPIRFVESRMIANFGATTLLAYSEYDYCEPWLIRLREISQDRNANIRAIIEGTVAEKRFEDILAFGAAWPDLDDSYKVDIPFDFDARVQLFNAAVVAIANYQARVTWEAQHYRVADKLSMGIKYESLDEGDQALADKFLLERRIMGGSLPMEYPKGDLQYTFIGNYSGNPAINTDNNLVNRSVPDGYKLVLTKVWCSHPVANFGNLELRVFQDRTRVLTMFPFCHPNWTTATRDIPAVDLWIPALSNMRVALHSTTGHAATIAGCEIELRRLTIWDKMAWGLDKSKRITSVAERAMIEELDLFDKLNAGIYELVTPQPEMPA